MRSTIGSIKLFVFFLSTLVTFCTQGVLLMATKGRMSLIYPLYYHRFLCWLLGIKVIVEGDIDHDALVYAGNHVSYLDIMVMGSLVKGSFIAKKDIESWPIIGALGKMGRTLYISRDPAHATKEIQAIQTRVGEGAPVIVFPEGTSSNGKQILPFKSSFFEIFLNKNIKIQPFTISIISVDGKTPETDDIRDIYAWYGDMNFEPHLWLFSKVKGCVIKVKFHNSVLTDCYKNRKLLSGDVYNSVCQGLDLSLPAQ